MNVPHNVGLKLKSSLIAIRWSAYWVRMQVLGRNQPNFNKKYCPVNCRTEVMENDSEMRHDGLSYPLFSEIQGMGYILRTGTRMCIIGIS